jgi:hypothetical protein
MASNERTLLYLKEIEETADKVILILLNCSKQSLRAITHYALFGHSLVFSCFINCPLFNDTLFSCLYLNSTTYKNMKTLNYGQKVHSVYSPLNQFLPNVIKNITHYSQVPITGQVWLSNCHFRL